MNVENIASVAHAVNKVYCISIGDNSQVDWSVAPDHIKKSVVDGVNFIVNNPDAGPDASHNNWLKFKKEEGGWKYAPIKNLEKKEHPCFVPYDNLPEAQKLKDSFFVTVVKNLIPYLQEYSTKETVGGLNKTLVGDNSAKVFEQGGIVHSFSEDGKRTADLSHMTRKPI